MLKESALLLHLWASARWKKVTLDSSGPRHRPPHGQDGQTGYPWDHLPPINSVILKQWFKEDEAVLSDTWLCASCVGIGGGSLDLSRPVLDSWQVCPLSSPVIFFQAVLLFLSIPKQLWIFVLRTVHWTILHCIVLLCTYLKKLRMSLLSSIPLLRSA